MFNIQYLKYSFPKIGISQVTIFVYIFIYTLIIFTTTFPCTSSFFELLCVLMFSFFIIFYWILSISLYFICGSIFIYKYCGYCSQRMISISTFKHTIFTNKETNFSCTLKIPYLMVNCDKI